MKAPKKESKVLRDEQTFTTTRKQWPIKWIESDFQPDGKRSVEFKKAIWIELFRGVEFFPSRFVAKVLKDAALMKNRDPKEINVEKLREFLEGYVESTRQVGVMHFDKRPRPNTQIELEDELSDAYGTMRQQDSVIHQQSEQLEDLRKRLAAAEKKGGAA
jgi:hypothetical protein